MGATREAVFGSRELSLKINTFGDTSRNAVFTGVFAKGSKITSWDPNHVEWDERTFSEKLAPFVGRNDAPPVSAAPDETNKVARMAKIAHVISVPADRLFYNRELGQLKPDAQGVIDAALKQGLDMVQRSKELLCALALLDNFTINSTVVPGSKTKFNFAWGNSAVNGGDWSDITSLIISQLIDGMIDTYRQTAGLLPAQIYINRTTEGYIKKNTEFQAMLATPLGATTLVKTNARVTEVLNGLEIGGLNWTKHLGGYKKDGTTWSDFMPDDKTIMLPEDAALPGVLAMAEGYNLVPAKLWGTGDNVEGQVMQAATPGLSVYSELHTRPMRVDLVIEWLGLPIILFPKGVQVGSI